MFGSLFGQSEFEDVCDLLEDLKINASAINSEKDVEKIIAAELRKDFDNVHQQFNIGGYLGIKVDIDIGEEIGIEIKLASQLDNASKIHRFIGQSVYYNNRKYNGQLIALIIGTKKDKGSALFKELTSFLEELGIVVIFNVLKGK